MMRHVNPTSWLGHGSQTPLFEISRLFKSHTSSFTLRINSDDEHQARQFEDYSDIGERSKEIQRTCNSITPHHRYF